MTRLFLDTEWADAEGRELVSLALVSEDGEHEFYAERAELPAQPTPFARDVVYPLLDRGDAAMSDVAMTTALRAFLSRLPSPFVLADFPNDLRLLRHVLAGFDLPESEAQACGPVPQPVLTRMLKEGRMARLIEEWFQTHPEQQARRHHALVDAHALRMAWLIVTERLPQPDRGGRNAR